MPHGVSAGSPVAAAGARAGLHPPRPWAALLVLGISALALDGLLQTDRNGALRLALSLAPDTDVASHILWLLEWLLMCTAMMLPTTLPLLAALGRTTAGLRGRSALLLTCSVGFISVWLLLGLAWRAVAMAWMSQPPLAAWAAQHREALLAALAAGGGAYLLSPIAERCAKACRSPFGFVARYWTGLPGRGLQALRMGMAHGVSCMGCCWPAMVMMCAAGAANPAWMLLLTLVMLLQKTPRVGPWATKASGLALLALGVALATGAVASKVAPSATTAALARCLSL